MAKKKRRAKNVIAPQNWKTVKFTIVGTEKMFMNRFRAPSGVCEHGVCR